MPTQLVSSAWALEKSEPPLLRVAQQLYTAISLLSSLSMAICTSIYPGGMLRIEQYRYRRGCQFTWIGIKSPHSRLFCRMYN